MEDDGEHKERQLPPQWRRSGGWRTVAPEAGQGGAHEAAASLLSGSPVRPALYLPYSQLTGGNASTVAVFLQPNHNVRGPTTSTDIPALG
jgi:hypothetical protein